MERSLPRVYIAHSGLNVIVSGDILQREGVRVLLIVMMGQPDAIIYTIGIFEDQDADRKPRALKRLFKDTGGEAFLQESLKDVVSMCEQIARDIGINTQMR